MVKIYENGDLLKAYQQKKHALTVFFAALTAYLLVCIGIMLKYISLPYNDSMQTPLKWLVAIASVIFIFWALPYMGIRYHRIRYYCKMMNGIALGIKYRTKCIFVRVDEVDVYDSVDVYSIIVREWNSKKMGYSERRLYSVCEKPMPKIPAGKKIEFISVGNLLLEYRLLNED